MTLEEALGYLEKANVFLTERGIALSPKFEPVHVSASEVRLAYHYVAGDDLMRKGDSRQHHTRITVPKSLAERIAWRYQINVSQVCVNALRNVMVLA
jgi:hypothetical protein